MERRKKAEEGGGGRVEVTRVNPDSLIDELLRSTNLTQSDESQQSEYKGLFVDRGKYCQIHK